ncbi:hypothetical protein RvY_19289 [Ramazzottius varieornatus]|uniref:oligopeptidase A n=1 Tax=Ramazzottius varieornatus TaxID=947166 RepID=A0A1D1WAV1_RAMVA|nr:hypothetical protein RvY_19289 [Ramazzottius varieornatus]
MRFQYCWRLRMLEVKPLRSPRRTFFATLPAGNGYYILLPPVPADTPETNPLMRTSGPPQFDSIDEDHVLNGLGKTTINHETAFYRYEEDIQKMKTQRTFEAVFDPLDQLNHDLVHTFTTAKILSLVKSSPKLDNAIQQSQQGIARCRALPNGSQTVLRSIKEINNEQAHKLSEAQQRVLSRYLLEARLAGAELNSADSRLHQSIYASLEEKKDIFRSNLIRTSEKFSSALMDPTSMDEAPKNVIDLLLKTSSTYSVGPVVTLKPPVYHSFMKYCRDRRQRWNVWRAFVGRAGFGDASTNNSLVIEDIRQLRAKEAKLFGYENYAALSMETKMARSVADVMSAVSEMTIPSKAKCQTELSSLQSYASENGLQGELKMWDMAYWRRKQREALFRINDEEVRQYFPFETVFESMLRLAKDLFQVTIKKDTSKQFPVWHEDMQFYKIFDQDGAELSGFYLDPYARIGEKDSQARCELAQNRSKAANASPLAALIFSFLPPTNGKPSMLTYDEVSSLFQKFGTALQHLLTTVPYGDVSGVNNVEWDALNVCGATFRMFLNNPSVLKSLSKHAENGQQIPDDLIQRLYQSERHLSSLDLLSEMYFGVLDLSLYTKGDFWQDITKDVWRDFMPFALEKVDAHPCGFSHVFVGHYAAAYYSFLWSEMVAADVYSAFNDAGFGKTKEAAHMGRMFRDTFLSLGGSCHAAEVFRRFRGRQVSPQALLQFYNIV